MNTKTTVPPEVREHMELLRRRVPCPFTDPFEQQQYEQALIEWVNMPAVERDTLGFSTHLGSLTSLGLFA